MKFKIMPMFGVVFTTTTTLLILLSSSVSGLTLEEKIRDDSDLSQVSKSSSLTLKYIRMKCVCATNIICMMNIKRIIFRCLCVDVKLFVNYIFLCNAKTKADDNNILYQFWVNRQGTLNVCRSGLALILFGCSGRYDVKKFKSII